MDKLIPDPPVPPLHLDIAADVNAERVIDSYLNPKPAQPDRSHLRSSYSPSWRMSMLKACWPTSAKPWPPPMPWPAIWRSTWRILDGMLH